MRIFFVNSSECHLLQRETKSMSELPVDVSEMHSVATAFIRNSQWHCQALAVLT